MEGETLMNHVLYCVIETEKVHEKGLFLVDLTDAELNLEHIKYLAEVSKIIQPFVQKSAILGIKNYIVTLFKIYIKLTGSKAKIFNEKEEAQGYLLSV